MRRYYRQNPQLDSQKAVNALKRAEQVLRDNPFAGSRYEDREDVRIFPLTGTVFAFLYTVARDVIWIIDVHDRRGLRSSIALRNFIAALEKQIRG